MERMGEVNEVILTGDYAQGIDSGTIEVIIKGDSLNESYLEHLTGRIEELIDRKVIFCINKEINPKDSLTLYKR